MISPEHGLALSDTATDYIKWLDGDGHIKPYLAIQSANPSEDDSIWDSVMYDVRGKPDITLQFSGSGDSETTLKVSVYTSLDGFHWNLLPEEMMQIVPVGNLSCDGLSQTLLMIFLRTNFIRIHAWLPGGRAPFPPFVMQIGVVAGEA